MDEYIYYVRDPDNRPMVTVCLMKNEQGKYARGVAICSLKDSPCKEEGRMRARGRALRAFKKAEDGKPWATALVNRKEAYNSLMKANRPILPMKFFEAKSCYSPTLNRFEEVLIGKQAAS